MDAGKRIVLARGFAIGFCVGWAMGFLIGAGVGHFNERVADPDDLEELFVGFAEYSMEGLSLYSAMVCAILGAVGGVSGGWVRRRSLGIVLGLLMSLLALGAFTALSHPLPDAFLRQEVLVWTIGGSIGAMSGSGIRPRW